MNRSEGNSSSKISITVDVRSCIHCRTCEHACPSGVFTFEQSEQPNVRHAGRCISCGHCVAICPHGALAHSGLAADKFAPVPEQNVSFDDLCDVLRKRRSCRLFTEDPIERETLERLIDASRHAPTSTNAQNVKHLVLMQREEIDVLAQATARYYLKLLKRLENPITRMGIAVAVGKRIVEAYRYRMPAIVEMFDKLRAGQDPLFRGATAVLVLFAPGMPHIASASCNLAAGQILLLADALGLGAFYNGYALTALVRDKRARQALSIPSTCTAGAVIALGKKTATFHKIPPRNARRIIWGCAR